MKRCGLCFLIGKRAVVGIMLALVRHIGLGIHSSAMRRVL